MRHIAIVLAAGRGKRMNSAVAKQYLLIKDKPVLYYSLKAFEDSPRITEVVLVTGADEMDYCRNEIVEKYGFSKVLHIVPGGKERYHSVYEGLKSCEGADYVYNSELTYELCVLKKYAIPLLKEIGVEDEYYITANRLLKYLKYFTEIEEFAIPCNSLLREFIGGSCFYDV